MTTQYARASYQEIIDLHTESDTVSVIGIHTPTGDTPRKMFSGFFDQFKKFKYKGCSISLVPAARLPADPLQVSYEAGETTIDPRDMLNPIMFHGCHGNDMGTILNRLYNVNNADFNSDSVAMEQNPTIWDSLSSLLSGEIPDFQLEDLYYKALTDNTWKKAHPQRGFRKSGLRPLVYKMATNMQFQGANGFSTGLGIPGDVVESDDEFTIPVSNNGRQFFTPGLTGLGWLDTRNVLTSAVTVDYDGDDYDSFDDAIEGFTNAVNAASATQVVESSLPLIYMGMIMLPPAYKTEQYYRMIINHVFEFKDFRGISLKPEVYETPAYFDFNSTETSGGTTDDEIHGDEGGNSGDSNPDIRLGSYVAGTTTINDVEYYLYETIIPLIYSSTATVIPNKITITNNVSHASSDSSSAYYLVPKSTYNSGSGGSGILSFIGIMSGSFSGYICAVIEGQSYLFSGSSVDGQSFAGSVTSSYTLDVASTSQTSGAADYVDDLIENATTVDFSYNS